MHIGLKIVNVCIWVWLNVGVHQNHLILRILDSVLIDHAYILSLGPIHHTSPCYYLLLAHSHVESMPISSVATARAVVRPRQVWIADKDALKQVIQQIDFPRVMMYAEISRE